MKPTRELIQAIAVTCELTGTVLTDAAAHVMAADLARYPKDQVIGALVKCRREIRTRLTVADVIARLDDGRPGPEQAWAMVPRNEFESAVLTHEMMQALAVAQPLLNEDNPVAARMAFLEAYRKLVMDARDRGEPPTWFPSLGHDPSAREGVLHEAERLGRISSSQVTKLLPNRAPPAPAVLKAIELKE